MHWRKPGLKAPPPTGETRNSSVVLRNCNKAHCSAILVCSCQHPFQRLASHAVVLSNLPWFHGWVLGVKCSKIHSKPRESYKGIHQKSSGWRIKDTEKSCSIAPSSSCNKTLVQQIPKGPQANVTHLAQPSGEPLRTLPMLSRLLSMVSRCSRRSPMTSSLGFSWWFLGRFPRPIFPFR